MAAVTLFVAAAPAGAQAGLGRKLHRSRRPRRRTASQKPHLRTDPRRGFNVVLLLGDMQGADAQDSIPVAARKALVGHEGFLPYKSYRLLDTQWIIGGTSGPALTRLRGAEEQEYRAGAPGLAGVDAWRSAGHIGAVRAARRRCRRRHDEAGSTTPVEQQNQKDMAAALFRAETGREIYQLEQERDDLTLQVNKGRQQVEVGMQNPDEVKRLATRLDSVNRRISDLKRTQDTKAEKAGGRPVIDTSSAWTTAKRSSSARRR